LKIKPDLTVSGDTYAMAYKAFNKTTVKELNLTTKDVNNAFAAASVVFAI